jgi:hypothetical protein
MYDVFICANIGKNTIPLEKCSEKQPAKYFLAKTNKKIQQVALLVGFF